MYKRLTANSVELSEARRRASLSRKVCRGGRPKGVFKSPDGLPVKTIAVDADDHAIINNYAKLIGKTAKGALHHFARCLVLGTTSAIPKRLILAPEGWLEKNGLGESVVRDTTNKLLG